MFNFANIFRKALLSLEKWQGSLFPPVPIFTVDLAKPKLSYFSRIKHIS